MSRKTKEERLEEVMAMLGQCNPMEVQSMDMAPYYGPGDVLMLHPIDAPTPRTQIAVKLRSGKSFIGSFVENRRGRLMVQGLDTQMQVRGFMPEEVLSVSKIVMALHV
jgi:hypothetical protein